MIRKILEAIESNGRFLVAAHRNPDGDAIASTLALGNALREMGKETTTFNADPVPSSYLFLPGADAMVQQVSDRPQFFEVGFILDSGELSRAGDYLKDRCRTLVNIDHHRNAEVFGAINYLDPDASSTGILIHRLLKNYPRYRFSSAVATCIYTAILSDTGSFRFANTDKESFQVAAELLDYGIDPCQIASHLYENQEARIYQLLGQALSSLKLSQGGRVASISVSLEEMEKTGTSPVHTDGFINYPRSIRGVEVALFFRQDQPNLFKVGFRSRKGIDVGSLARSLGGGGHANASGATLEGSLHEIQEKVLARLDALLSATA
ncbi:MAG: bifunctional oligoribonuclease/PAP phosphatase NrnA [Deltaproteobacteria bacterium]|nr:bifunctional oligoribonuclease/PAP phosphatase NrnA [Deltaproteobacteria bacterium]